MRTDPYDPSEEFLDDRPIQSILDTADPTQHRESRPDEPKASEFGVDNRPEEDRRDNEGEQSALVTGGDDGQQALDGESTAGRSLWGDPDSEGTLMDRLAQSARNLRAAALEPLPEPEAAMTLDDGTDQRELEGTALEPEDFELVAGWHVPENQEYHPDDQHREDRFPADEESVIGENLAAAVEETTEAVYDPTEEQQDEDEPEESTDEDDENDWTPTEQPEIPEQIAGYELEEETNEVIEWTGINGRRPPASFDHNADWTTSVRVRSHGGRYDYRYSVSERVRQGDSQYDSTIGGATLTRNQPDDGKSENRARAITKAIEWMEDNPADGAGEPQPEPDQDLPDLPNGFDFSGVEHDEDSGISTWMWQAPSDIPGVEYTTIHLLKIGSTTFDLSIGPDGDQNPRGSFENHSKAVERAEELARETTTVDSSESTESDPQPEPEPTATTDIEFDRLDVANHFRDEHTAHLAESDDRRTKVVVVREDASEDVLDRATAQAAESRAHKAEQFGQAELTKAELRDLKRRPLYGPHKRFHAQAAKAILLGKGVEDWLAYYDVRATVDEHRGIAENALREDGGSEARPARRFRARGRRGRPPRLRTANRRFRRVRPRSDGLRGRLRGSL